MSIQNSEQYNLSYRGTVFVYRDNILLNTYYNQGTEYLSKLFAKAIGGEFSKLSAPSFIDLTYDDFRSCLNNPAVITGRHIECDERLGIEEEHIIRPAGFRAYLEATISKDNILQNSDTIQAHRYLVLKDGTGEQNILAYVGVDDYIEQDKWFEKVPYTNKYSEESKNKYIANNINIVWQLELLYSSAEFEEIS